MSLFPRVYALARRAGLTDRPWFEHVFGRSYFLYKRWLEDPFHDLARRSPELFRGGNVIDVGANIGYDAVVFARAAELPFRVLAIEPEARNLAMLERSVARHGVAARVRVVRAAVGAADGTARLWRNEDHHGDHRVATQAFRRAHPDAGTEVVPLRTVDSLVAEHLDGPVAFVKIDVQGYEPAVLAGMRRTLEANRRIAVAFEYAPDGMRELGEDPEAMLAVLREGGFRLRGLAKNGRTAPASRAELDAVVRRRGYTDVLAVRDP
jgi:FkbM family methyltransferase